MHYRTSVDGNHWSKTNGEWTRILDSDNYTSYVNTSNFPGLNKVGTVTSVTVTGANGLSGTGTVTSSGTITLSNAGVRSTTINGNYLRVNTNGTNTDLTIPYATYASSAPAAANYGTASNTTKIKININSTKLWMLSFVVTIYQGYRSSKIMVSGYNYGSDYWYMPKAVLLGDSNGNTSIPVYFGYDSVNNLWVGFDGDDYTGVSISDVTNGYDQVSSFNGLFTISNVSSLSTLQTTVNATNSVNYAVSAGSVEWGKVTGKPSSYTPAEHNHDTLYAKKDGTGASGTWGIDITGSAGSVAWDKVSSKPATATRWPSWSEVTNKPSSFTPSSHTHSYLPLSGGTVTGNLNLTGLEEGTSDVTDNTELLTSYASDNGFSDASGKVYRRDAIKVYNYIKGKLDLIYSYIGHEHTISEITDFPTSLPANGGNADTVDGQNFSYSNSSNSPTYLWATNSNGSSFLAARTSLSVNYASNADKVDNQHANRFAWIYNSANYLTSTSVSCNDIAADSNSNAHMGMINSPTSNPTGSAKWVHVWSQTWNRGDISAWVSQIALGVQDGTGMWYRASQGALSSKGWTRVIDDSNWSSYIDEGYVMKEYTIDASGLNSDTWYPVTFYIGSHKTVRIECRVSLNSGTTPSWSMHTNGFSVRKIWETNGSGWGSNPVSRRILVSNCFHASTDPVRGIGQLINSSNEYVYVRGGGKYYFYTSHNITPVLHTSDFTQSGQTLPVTTSTPESISVDVGATSTVYVHDSSVNDTYRMVCHSENTLYRTDGIYCNPSSGALYAKAFYESSDERLKDFENNINVDLNVIGSIPKMYFRWKKNPNKLQIGTSAQAVKQIYPELVTSSDDGMLSVDYSKLSIVALSAIDKLHLENKELKREIKILKQEIEKIKGQK